MGAFDWESFLRQWSQDILESMTDEEKRYLPSEVLVSGWLGYPGATEAEIASAELRLGVKLPPSYREFLKVTNGWRQTASKHDNFNHRFWSIEDIEQFSVRHSRWISAFAERTNHIDVMLDSEFQELNDHWEPVGIADDDYFVYGHDQDPRNIRPEYLRTAIEISDVGFDSIYLLNPRVITPEGEWEAWFFADYLPGADRYRSFREMMAAEYRNFLELQESAPEAEDGSGSQPAPVDNEYPVADSPGGRQTLIPAGAQPESRVVPPSESSPETATFPWQSLKRLTIELQTRQVDDQAEYRTVVNSNEWESPEAWAGITEQRLWQWLQQHLAETDSLINRMEQPPVSSATSPPGAEALAVLSELNERDEQADTVLVNNPEATTVSQHQPAITLKLVQLVIRQSSQPSAQLLINPASLQQAQPTGIGALASEHPFSVEIEFQLVGEQIVGLAWQDILHKTQVFAQNLLNHQWILLGGTVPISLDEGCLTYTSTLFHQTLDPGIYRLQIIISLSGAVAALSTFELPLLNIM
jgi:hypothetical protein